MAADRLTKRPAAIFTFTADEKNCTGGIYRLCILCILYMYRGKQMDILLDNRSGTPIYMQICDQIRSQIADGTVQPDEALPSIRSLAKDLRISVITTKRAYEELEREGYIYTVAGKGCFAAEVNRELLKEEKLVLIEGLMNQICDAAASCGLQKEEVQKMWNSIWEDVN